MAVNFCSLRPLEAGEPPGPQGRIPQVKFEEFDNFFLLELFTFFYFLFFSNFSVKVFVLIAVHEPCSRDENT